ncbi:DUF2891 family protein [Bradyrhizobium sp. DASA03005]|uniref:DUF2891 family protein n=1 Tax=Bradyrhizobium sp. SPXBL-02 TaxID=3395912 RepID=UPI003F703F03
MSELTPKGTEAIGLDHVDGEYLNKLHPDVLTGSIDPRGPRALHPIFGSFDSVHAHYQRFADLRAAGEIRARLDGALRSPHPPVSTRGYNWPYGWAWLLEQQAQIEFQNFTALPH